MSPGVGRRLALGLLVACHDDREGLVRPFDREPVEISDQWTATSARCDWSMYWQAYAIEHPTPEAQFGDVVEGAPLYPSEDCVDAVLADLSVDIDAFVEVDGADPYAVAAPDPVPVGRLERLLTTARLYFLYDYGSVADLAQNELVSGTYVEQMRRAEAAGGAESVLAAQYDFVTSHVLSVVPDDCGAQDSGTVATFDADGRVMALCPWFELTAATQGQEVLLHEAAHYLTPEHVACVGSGWVQCDEDIEGSYGFSMAVHLALAQRYPDDGLDHLLLFWDRMQHVNSFFDSDGDFDASWYDMDPDAY